MASSKRLSPGGDLWLGRGGENILGESRVDLLEQIAKTGSITHAAKAVGISYRTAWSLVDRVNALAGQPVVERAAGGKSGGGTRLTAYGTSLLKAYRVLQKEHAKYVQGLRSGISDLDPFLHLARRISLRTSARNQLFGTVHSVRKTELEAEVVLTLSGGHRLVSRITRRSLDDLGIRKGNPVYALIKAGWVLLAPPVPAGRSLNVLKGLFEESRGKGGAMEVVLRLEGGDALSASLARKPRGVRLEKGAPVTAYIDPSNVILGIP